MRLLTPIALAGANVAVSAQAKMFHWPNRQMEWVDTTLFELNFFENTTLNCASRDNTTVAAQWIRLAFYDMATHNVDDGTGELDGSIIYEFDRPENIGVNRSILDFAGFGSRFFGLADILAAGTVVASLECGGPYIPYRIGRIDATGPGAFGTPEPQHDLNTLTESFRKQGFTRSEMIALTACGLALGGGKTTTFTNGGVTDHLDGTTENPLVVGVNATMHSDLRVFMSDRNATIQSLSSLETFDNTCAALFERMINTVPSSVTLTDVIEPWDYKVGEARISVANDSDTLLMQTTLRLLDVEDNPNREVKLVWVDKDGSCSQGTCSSPATTSNRITGTTLFRRVFGKTALQYNFVVNGINPVKSIKKLWFEIDEKDGSQPTVVKNDDGQGYVISQYDVLFDIIRSILYADSLTSITNFASEVVIAVKDTLVENGGTAPIHIETANSFITVPFKFEVLKPKLDTRFNHTAGYTFFSFVPTEFLTSAFDVYYGEVAPDNLGIQFGQVFEARNQVIGPLP